MDRSFLLSSLASNEQTFENKLKDLYKSSNSSNFYSYVLLNGKSRKKYIPNDNNINTLVNSILSKTQRDMVRAKIERVIYDDNVSIKHGAICNACQLPAVTTRSVQLRSGDEGETLIRECQNCGSRQ